MMGCTRQVIQNAEKGVRKTQTQNLAAMVEAFASVAPMDPTQRGRFMDVFGLPAAVFDEAARKGEAKRVARLGRAPAVDASKVPQIVLDCCSRLDDDASVGMARIVMAMTDLIEQAKIKGRSDARQLGMEPPMVETPTRRRSRRTT